MFGTRTTGIGGGAERLLHRAHAGERERAERDAVVGDLARDRLVRCGSPLGQVVLADDLPGGLDRLRAAVGEEDAVEVAGRALGDRLREVDRRRVRGRPVGVERERGQLLRRRGRHLLAERVADLGAEQRREPVEVALAVGVEDVGALAALEHQQRLAPGPEGAVAREVHQQVAVRALLQVGRGERVRGGHVGHGRHPPGALGNGRNVAFQRESLRRTVKRRTKGSDTFLHARWRRTGSNRGSSGGVVGVARGGCAACRRRTRAAARLAIRARGPRG